MNKRPTAQTPRSDAIASAIVNGSAAGRVRPYQNRTVSMYMRTAKRPGTIPAMNNVPMSVSVMKP